jgi:alkanesulfonate monooxygenase SsuD/methylene tetrahydromethanopterin reductase-like flavin-dependent oxidoreductase (luciferase family)
MAAGGAFAGTPAQAREWLAADAEAAGATYLVADLAFGDMSFDEARRSAELLAGEVMPGL